MVRSRKVLRDKLELIRLAEELGSVTAACKQVGFSRDSYYRLKRAFEEGGEVALRQTTRRKPNLKNRLPPEVEGLVIEVSLSQPAKGKLAIAKELNQRGVEVSPAGVRNIWLRHRIETHQQRMEHLARIDAVSSQAESDSEGVLARDSESESIEL